MFKYIAFIVLLIIGASKTSAQINVRFTYEYAPIIKNLEMRYSTDSLILQNWVSANQAIDSIFPYDSGVYFTMPVNLDSLYFYSFQYTDTLGNIGRTKIYSGKILHTDVDTIISKGFILSDIEYWVAITLPLDTPPRRALLECD